MDKGRVVRERTRQHQERVVLVQIGHGKACCHAFSDQHHAMYCTQKLTGYRYREYAVGDMIPSWPEFHLRQY
jgi:hypothetical protein